MIAALLLTLVPFQGIPAIFWNTPRSEEYTNDIWVDVNSGDNEKNDGYSQDRPLKTLQKAATLAVAGTKVHIMPGVYRETITPDANGIDGKPILYIAEKGAGTVFIRGSEPASSLKWSRLSENTIGLPSKVDPKNIYYTNLSSWGLKSIPRFIVELDNKGNVKSRLMPAREPDLNVESGSHISEYWWMADGGSSVAGCNPENSEDKECDSPTRSFIELTDTSNDQDPFNIEEGNISTLPNLTGAILVALDDFNAHFIYRRTIIADDVTKGQITVDKECDHDGDPGLGWGSKYYIENHPALLDQPGEWWFDLTNGFLYLWSPEGINPEQFNFEISKLDDGFILKNRSYTNLDGLTIELFNRYAYSIENDDPTYKSLTNKINNTVLRYANVGVLLYQYMNQNTPKINAIDGFTLENSKIEFMDTVGLDSGIWWPDAPNPDQFDHSGVLNTVIRKNEIHDIGFNSDEDSGVGVRFLFPDKLRFEDNIIKDIAQKGVHLHLSLIKSTKEFGFDSNEILLGEILVKGNVIQRACSLASDCGALTIGGNNRPYTHVFRDFLITDNVFRDSFGWSYVSIKRGKNSDGDGNGVYVDRASGIHVYRNTSYNNSGAGYKLNCLWRDGAAIIYNNIAADNFVNGFKFTDSDASCDNHNGSVDTELGNNILVHNGTNGISIESSNETNDFGNLVIDHNLYYQNGWNIVYDGITWSDLKLMQERHSPQYFQNLSQIQVNTPWEAHGAQSDPAFVHYNFEDKYPRDDKELPDFQLTSASSQALDGGTADLPASLKTLLLAFQVEDMRYDDAYDIGRFDTAEKPLLPSPTAIPPKQPTRQPNIPTCAPVMIMMLVIPAFSSKLLHILKNKGIFKNFHSRTRSSK
jgi:hypothetical protein